MTNIFFFVAFCTSQSAQVQFAVQGIKYEVPGSANCRYYYLCYAYQGVYLYGERKVCNNAGFVFDPFIAQCRALQTGERENCGQEPIINAAGKSCH